MKKWTALQSQATIYHPRIGSLELRRGLRCSAYKLIRRSMMIEGAILGLRKVSDTTIEDRSRAYHHSEVECNTKELSSGKVVSSRHYQTHVSQRGDHLGANTSKPFGSQSSHTPPPRPVRERLEFPSEQSSERTLSNSNERRSALERISEPDLRNSISRDKPRSSGVQDRLMVLEGIEGSSSAPRIPAPLRLQDSDSEGQINITIPHVICKTGAKRKTPDATPQETLPGP
ncbi:hypothetical protein DY000_02023199 [Brassica cretica]|uniref:DUF4005 domain-containing protein n=1 Tax=Brassica cretica TaxID=69181 RepID=A0ABQ7E5A5_BRACR|nr:hypothetical protein DY000_02023199 [Brassica cretica]